ncbi:putative uncharacterized protein DDB_G0282133 isoform X1 [Drosophila innubila]|uniref:putative uncharacterized protein DDB_G0282133 isoform X1 n=1 Tax=Drosophila innubila TaxID=198719 RepID=UPI00148BC3F9|nr:putative uncharacterized protein DDB_G0282133 isoform X1 [Drosophila innubila]
MSRRTNFIDGSDNFREQNLRFVRNELEDNFNQFFSGGGGGAASPGGSAAAASGSRAPPRDSIVVQPTPDSEESRRIAEIQDRRQYISEQLGLSRKQAQLMAVASMEVPDFNMREIQRKRFRLSVEFGDSRQAEVNALIAREIKSIIEAHEQRKKKNQDRPRTPPPPCNINWNASRESSPIARDRYREREKSPENYGLVRRTDDNRRRTDNVRQIVRNDSYRQADRNHHGRKVERSNDVRQVLRNDHFRGVERRDNDRGQRQSIDRNDNSRQVDRNENFRQVDRNDSFRQVDRIVNLRPIRGNDRQRQSIARNDNFRDVDRNDSLRQVDRSYEQRQSIARNDNFREIDRNDNDRVQRQSICRNDNFRGLERNDNLRQVERNDNFRVQNNERQNNFVQVKRNFEQNDNFRRNERNLRDHLRQNIERNDNLRLQNFERSDTFQGEQNNEKIGDFRRVERDDQFFRGQNNDRIDNFRRDDRQFERDERYRDQQTQNDFDNNNSRFVDNRRNPNLEDIDFNQRNVDFEQFGNDDRLNNLNREPNFGLVRQENCSIDNLRGNFDRNFENSNRNDYDNRDYRSVQMHLQDNNSYREINRDDFRQVHDITDLPNERNSIRHNRFENNFGDEQPNDRFYNNARDDNTFRRPDFPESFLPATNFNDQRTNEFGLSISINADYNAVLDNDGFLANDRRSLDNDFRDRSVENLNNFADLQSGQLIMKNDGNQMNWYDDRRNYELDDNRCINPTIQNELPRNQMNNRNKPNTLDINERINNGNRLPPVSVNKKNSQPPANRTANAVSKKPSTVTSTTNTNVATISIFKGQNSDNSATSSQPKIPNTKPSNNKRTLLPNPAAAARAIGQKNAAESVNSEPLKKKRKVNLYKRGFLVGGYRLPYVNKNLKELPQPEEESYAVTFFEQKPIYNTCIYAQDNDGAEVLIDTDDDDNSDDEAGPSGLNMQPVLLGKIKRSAIRKRIDKTWTKIYRLNNYKCWHTWWKAFKWCELEMNKKLEKFGNLNIKSKFLPIYPKKSTQQVIDIVMRSAHFALEENTRNHFRDSKTLYMLMNDTFLENLKYPEIEQLQDMIRGIPNHLWAYKMRSMVYIWAEYFKTASPKTGNPRDFAALQAKWKNPVFHWLCKQSFEELKAISAVEWPEHNEVFPNLKSRPV